MTRRFSTLCWLILGTLCWLMRETSGQAAEKLNLVFILADDLGWRDVGFNGSPFYETPNLDRLARRGLRFTQAYAANPLCSPTRASILTGLYPARLGITTPSGHLPEVILQSERRPRAPAHRKALEAVSATRLPTNHLTLAKALQAAGYVTAHFGKWHLGAEPFSPLQHGFDLDVPHWPGPGPPGNYVAPWRAPAFRFPAERGEHLEDRMAAEAAKFIRTNVHRPFFLNYWAFSVHAPYDAKSRWVEKYRAKAAALPPDAPQRNPLYAAMIHSLDDAIGTLLRAIDEAGLAERTAIVFFSDNGGVHWRAMGQRGPPGRDTVAAEFADVPVTSNAPLRGGKATIYEGGTRVPCVVIWPRVTQPGAQSAAIVQSVDFFPTFAELLEFRLPPTLRLDGRSFVPALRGEPHDRGPLFCHFPHYVGTAERPLASPSTSVRVGDWKLIRFFCDGDGQQDRFELFDLRNDPGEEHDLAGTRADKIKELAIPLEQFLHDTGAVVPQRNPDYRAQAALDGTVAGFFTSGDASLAVSNGCLWVESSGNDPYFFTRGLRAGKGPYAVKWRMKSHSEGPGQVFWSEPAQPNFRLDRSVFFAARHDGAWHEYEIALPTTNALASLRLDPSTAPGKIQVEWLRLLAVGGRTIKEWHFD